MLKVKKIGATFSIHFKAHCQKFNNLNFNFIYKINVHYEKNVNPKITNFRNNSNARSPNKITGNF